jgi:hypothetical protein
MKKQLKWLMLLACVGLAVSAWGQESLADVARKARDNKRNTSSASEKVFTNDNLSLKSASGSQAEAKSDGSDDKAASQDKAEGSDESKAEGTDESGREKMIADWKARIDKEKNDIELLKRELDVAERENRLRAATFYADAGNRLRDEKKYAEDDRKYKAEIESKKQKIADEEKKLEQMRDDARRAGVPAGQIP